MKVVDEGKIKRSTHNLLKTKETNTVGEFRFEFAAEAW
jgi:hypothetical protein